MDEESILQWLISFTMIISPERNLLFIFPPLLYTYRRIMTIQQPIYKIDI